MVGAAAAAGHVSAPRLGDSRQGPVGTATAMREEAVLLAGRVMYFTAWAMVLVLAVFILVTLLDAGDGSSLVAADERLARAIAGPFKVLNGLHLRHGWM